MSYRQTIATAYDAGVEVEYNRLTETPLREAEYQLIIELLDEYIPSGSVVIDIGSGPGRYAEHLMKRNCKVGLIDLSAKSLKAFSDRMGSTCNPDNTIFNRVSCATQLNWVDDSTADAILLMGPLYHLVSDEHRNLTLAHCKRILKPHGLLFTVFLSPFLVSNNGLEIGGKEDIFDKKDLDKHSLEAIITYTPFMGFDIPQFRCMPEDAKKIMKSNGFETLRIRNIEGVASFMSSERIKKINTPYKKSIFLNNLRKTSELRETLGITHQFVVVSKGT
jgi:ubiquinone/menaquinone biosynthesis C-methylase UbiE